MTAPPVSAAPWCTIADLPARATEAKYELDLDPDGDMEGWIQVASDVLFDFTRRRWPGPTTSVIRPVSERYPTDLGVYCAPVRFNTDGVSEIRLPNPPVVSVTEVRLDGDTVDPGLWRVDNHHRLVFLPVQGARWGAWPYWQDLDAAPTEPGTFQVTYVHGTLPPPGGVRAAAELATELGIAASPKLAGQSRLPSRSTSVTRQGVSAALRDPLLVFDQAQTGIASVDMWISSVNYGATNRTGSVRRFGRPRTRRET